MKILWDSLNLKFFNLYWNLRQKKEWCPWEKISVYHRRINHTDGRSIEGSKNLVNNWAAKANFDVFAPWRRWASCAQQWKVHKTIITYLFLSNRPWYHVSDPITSENCHINHISFFQYFLISHSFHLRKKYYVIIHYEKKITDNNNMIK